MNQPSHRIVIVGGGAGGLPLATKLGERHGRKGPVRVTLVDRTHVGSHSCMRSLPAAWTRDLDYNASALARLPVRTGALAGLDRARRCIQLDAVHSVDGESPAARANTKR
jgi:NADH dehydrogenase